MTNSIVAIGCDERHDYSACLPLVGRFWRRVGYEPLFLLVGDWRKPHARIVCEELKGIFPIEYVAVPQYQYPGIRSASISQGIRQHAAAFSWLAEDTLLIPSDADLFPLRRDFYHQHEDPITLYYANAHEGEENTHVPACHMSMRVKTWRQVMGYGIGDPLDALCISMERLGMQRLIDARAADPKQWEGEWYFMQRWSSGRIFGSGLSIKRVNREGRPPVDRLDRAYWPEHIDISRFTDCHTIRPLWTEANWKRFRPVVEQVIPESLEWADDYIARFREAMGVNA